MNIDRFPILAASLKTPRANERFLIALKIVSDGVEFGSVRNAELKDAKEALSRIVGEAWNAYVNEPYFYGGAWNEQPVEAIDLQNTISVYGLHDVISASKRINKSTVQCPAVNAMRAFCEEVLPLSEAVASLKDKIVKGRAPATPKPVNPNKVVKTCACCFRQIAVVGSTMAHHGYERPDIGWQTASCDGIRFKPLEVSNEGLVYVISRSKSRLTGLQASYDSRGSLTELRKNGLKRNSLITIHKGSKDWDIEFKYYVLNLQSKIKSQASNLEYLEAKLAKWKQVDFDAELTADNEAQALDFSPPTYEP